MYKKRVKQGQQKRKMVTMGPAELFYILPPLSELAISRYPISNSTPTCHLTTQGKGGKYDRIKITGYQKKKNLAKKLLMPCYGL